MLGNYLTSGIRTGVPGLIGALLAWLASAHINAPAGTDHWLTALLTFVLLLGYYLAVRALESRWPQLGWLLGTPTKPTYDLDLTPVSVTNPPATSATTAPAVARMPAAGVPPAAAAPAAKKVPAKKVPAKKATPRKK